MSEYDTDIVLWSEHQAALLRRLAAGERVNDQVDFAHLIEEIEALGESDHRALRSDIRTILLHLMKLIVSPASDPRAGWMISIGNARASVEDLLSRSPSLRRHVAPAVTVETKRAAKLATLALTAHGETPRVEIDALVFTPEQVLDDWFPDES